MSVFRNLLMKNISKHPIVDNNTILLLHLDNSLDDSAIYNNSITQAIEDEQHEPVNYGVGKFGQAINSNYNLFSYTDNKFINAFINEKLTIDFWMKLPFKTSTNFLCHGETENINKFIIGIGRYRANDGTIQIYIKIGNTYVAWEELIDAPTFIESEFNHFAFIINTNTITLYINGVNTYQVDITGSFSDITSLAFEIGQHNLGGINSSIDEVRISNIERWTSNFIPPSKPY